MYHRSDKSNTGREFNTRVCFAAGRFGSSGLFFTSSSEEGSMTFLPTPQLQNSSQLVQAYTNFNTTSGLNCK